MTLEDQRTEAETATASAGRELVPVPVHDQPSLAGLAASINHYLDLITKAEKAVAKAESTAGLHRLRAGQYLIDARKLVPQGEWLQWCKDNIKRSQRDIQRLIKIASADDPEAALAQDRERGRSSMASSRANATNIGRIDEKPSTPAELFDSIRTTLDAMSDEDLQTFSTMIAGFVTQRVGAEPEAADPEIAEAADPEPELDRSCPWNHPLPDDEVEARPTDPAPVDPVVDDIIGDDAKAPETEFEVGIVGVVTPKEIVDPEPAPDPVEPEAAVEPIIAHAPSVAPAAPKRARGSSSRKPKWHGRTLTPAEIAVEAAALGFPVSQRAA